MAKERTVSTKSKAKTTKGTKFDIPKDFAEKLKQKAEEAGVAVESVRDDFGSNTLFLSLCQSGARALKEEYDDLYMPELKPRDFYIQSRKIILGKKLRVVPVLFLSVYNELAPAKTPKGLPKFVGVWHKDDAAPYDLKFGSYFDKELPNGNILQPVTWVICYLPAHPELENVVLTFKSTAQKVARAWRKDLDANGYKSHEAVCVLSSKVETNDSDQSWYQVSPSIEKPLIQFDTKGNVTSHENYAEKVLDLAQKYAEDYVKDRIIQRKQSVARDLPEIEDKSTKISPVDKEYSPDNVRDAFDDAYEDEDDDELEDF